MKKIGVLAAVAATVAAGALFGYKVATDEVFRGRLTRGAKDVVDASKKKVNVVTEDVALKTAQMTKNPKVNQEWVNNQWESIGY